MDATSTNEAVGFCGLGALGTPIAHNLLASGRTLTLWNRTASKAEILIQKGAKLAQKPSETIPRGGVVCTILWDDASLEEIVASPGFLDALGPGGIHLSMTTVTPETARKLARLHKAHGSTYVEATIFGIPTQAVARQLTFCVGGPKPAKERVQPLLQAMGGQRIFDFGEAAGAATATKLVGNYMIISAFAAMQEAFDVLKASDIDPKPTLEMLTTTLLATPGNQRYAGYLLSGMNPIGLSDIPLKDANLFTRFADSAHLPVPMARQLAEVLGAAKR